MVVNVAYNSFSGKYPQKRPDPSGGRKGRIFFGIMERWNNGFE